MSWIKLNTFVLLLVISESLGGLNILRAVSNYTTGPLEKNKDKDFIQIASENGYTAEKHEVITKDGYILTMFRIPPQRDCPKKTPMLLVHGLWEMSDSFISSGPEAPGFVLAQNCHDLWFANVRGNKYSRQHETLNPDKDLKFWKFSVDEIGSYDIPAMVDYVLDATDTKKLIYMCHSQGGGTFFIMNSEKPKYADKIGLFIGLAPASRHYHTRSEVFRLITKAVNSLETSLEDAGVWEILSNGFFLQGLLSSLCEVKFLQELVCGSAVAVLDAPDPDSITPEIAKKVFDTFPAGSSVQNVARYGQAMDEKKFVKFDYGSVDNLEAYGSTEPPEYDLGASTTPAVVLYGENDHIVDPRDVEWAVGQLPNLLELIRVDHSSWNHIDMLYSRYWRHLVFDRIKKYLDKYSDLNDPK